MPSRVPKGWGSEEILVSRDEYCLKYLHFNQGGKSSMHLHRVKREDWIILSGRFKITFIDTTDAQRETGNFEAGDHVYIHTMEPHQVYCTEAGTILEVSTKDREDDNYRVEPGDSQRDPELIGDPNVD
jgi:mannose-6-phosphate isomerase-like protein (cupin superfamily)